MEIGVVLAFDGFDLDLDLDTDRFDFVDFVDPDREGFEEDDDGEREVVMFFEVASAPSSSSAPG